MEHIIIPSIPTYITLKQTPREIIFIYEDNNISIYKDNNISIIKGFDIIKQDFFLPSSKYVSNLLNIYISQTWPIALNLLTQSFFVDNANIVKMNYTDNMDINMKHLLYVYDISTNILYKFNLFTNTWQVCENLRNFIDTFDNSNIFVINKTDEEIKRDEDLQQRPHIDNMIELPRFRDGCIHYYDPICKIIYSLEHYKNWTIFSYNRQISIINYSNRLMGTNYKLK